MQSDRHPDHPTRERIVLPADRPVTSEEIRRRRELFRNAHELRKEIGPIDIRTDELIRESRDEDLI